MRKIEITKAFKAVVGLSQGAVPSTLLLTYAHCTVLREAL